jgi:signal transduction histidine kinase
MSSARVEPPRQTSAPPAKRAWFRSLPFRLSAWYAGVLLVALTTLGGLALYTVRRAVVHSDEVVVRERLERHTAILERVGLPKFEEAIDEAAELEGEHGSVRVRDSAGRTLFQHGDVEGAATVVSTSLNQDLRLEVASSADPWDRVGPPVRAGVLTVLFGCLVFGIVGAVVVTRRALRPVAALTSTAQAVVRSGDLSRRVDVTAGGSGELEELARLVNQMLERNQTLVTSMRESLDNVAHDLRTPLTRLRGIAEVALRSETPTQAPEALADCIEESDRALVMLRTLMDISEAEAGIMRLDLAPIDLRVIAEETLELYEQVAEDAGVGLTLAPGSSVTALADGVRLRQAVANLVDNAVKYTPRGGRVSVETALDPVAQEAVLRVRDNGRGIPAEAIPRIWDRLFRVDPSRTERGLGLGLSLVRAIAEAHGGRVAVESAPEEGSTFVLTLPLSPPTSGGARR